MDKEWNIEKEALRRRFARLTNHNSDPGEGKNEEMLVRLQDYLGISKEELNKLLSDHWWITMTGSVQNKRLI